MSNDQPGVLESAVRRHHASPLVCYEAAALDRELQAAWPNHELMLGRLEDFILHYPAVLLREPAAAEAVFQGGRRLLVTISPGIRSRAARLLAKLLTALVAKGLELEVTFVDWERILRTARGIIEEIGRRGVSAETAGEVFALLLEIGRLVVMALEDHEPTEKWLELLEDVARLALCLAKEKLAGEPVYDGAFDQPPLAAELGGEQLASLRSGRLAAEAEWLEQLTRQLDSHQRQAMDVFLELAAFRSRDERQRAWAQWLEWLRARATRGGLSTEASTAFFRQSSFWIEHVTDRQSLRLLAQSLGFLVARIKVPAEAAGALLESIAARLESEAGKVEDDQALRELWQTAQELVRGALSGGEQSAARQALMELVPRLRLGPLHGAPLAAADVVWWLGLCEETPALAERLLPRMVTAVVLEDFALHELPAERGRLAGALSRALITPWAPHLALAVRTLLRLVPLPSFVLGGPALRTQAERLAATGEAGGYLEALCRRILAASPSEGLKLLDALLESWLRGKVDPLLDWLAPETLVSCDAPAEKLLMASLQRLLSSWCREFATAAGKGWEFLDSLGPEFEQTETLRKLIGFADCPAAALERLSLAISLRRNLQGRLAVLVEQAVGRDQRAVLEAAEKLLVRRRQLAEHIRRLAAAEPMACLDAFSEELATSAQAELLLGRAVEAVVQGQFVEDRGVGHLFFLLLAHARLSEIDSPILSAVERQPANWLTAEKITELLRWLEGERVWWRQALRPHVEDSLQRLRYHPLARPRPEAAQQIERFRSNGEAGVGLSTLVSGVLLEGEGFFPLLEELGRSLLARWRC